MSDKEKKKAHVLQLAWAAGVADARILWPKSGNVIRMETIDVALLRRFHETIKLGTLNERIKKDCVHSVWYWQSTGIDDTREILLLLSPFLSPRSLKFAGDIIARIERNALWRKRNPTKADSLVTAPAD